MMFADLFTRHGRLPKLGPERKLHRRQGRNWREHAPADYLAWFDSRTRLHRFLLSILLYWRDLDQVLICSCGRKEWNRYLTPPWSNDWACTICREVDDETAHLAGELALVEERLKEWARKEFQAA